MKRLLPLASRSRRFGLVAGGIAAAATSWILFEFTGDGFSAEGADAYLEESAQLAICVEVDPSLSTDLAAVHSAVQQAVRGGLRASHDEVHRRWLEEGSIEHMFAYTEPRVVAGCPDGYQGPPGEERLRYNLGVRTASVKSAGPFQVLILVTADAWFDSNGLASRSHVRTAYEHSCEDPHVCAEVSTALYLRESAVSDQALVVRALEAGFGWENALGREYPLGHPESEQTATKTD